MSMSLQSLIAVFLEWCGKNRQPRTRDSYRYHLSRWYAHIGDVVIEQLKPWHLSSWGETWHDIQAVQRLFAFAKDDLEVISRNPFTRVKRPPMGQRNRILSDKECAALLWRSRPAFRRYLFALRESMARPQEVRSLQWEWLRSDDPKQQLDEALLQGKAFFVLTDYKSRRQRNNPNAPRLILVNRRLGRLLWRLRRGLGECKGNVFTNTQERAWSNNAVRCCMRRLRNRALGDGARSGEKVVCYTFRHTGATNAAAAGVRDRVLAELLGHTSTRTTARYQHLHIGHLREAMERLEDFAS